ncbi:MAG TPA: hypothetical protein VGI86_19175, partial [Acidimicrobiia bacterium]
MRRRLRRMGHPSHTIRRWRDRHETPHPAPTQEEIQTEIRAELARSAQRRDRGTPPISFHVSLRKPVRRLILRYRRWRYEREMRMPTPAPQQHHTSRTRHALHRVLHPFASIRLWRERREAHAPAPAPLTEAERAGGPIKRAYIRVRLWLSHVRHGFSSWPVTAQVLVLVLIGGVLAGSGLGAKRLFTHHSSSTA